MKIIGFIEDNEIIEKILRHLGLWQTRNHDPPKSGDQQPANHISELTDGITYSHLPPIDYWTQQGYWQIDVKRLYSITVSKIDPS